MKRILLTGDDGFDSIGTKLLIRELQDHFELRVAGTNDQMSGVGGKLTFQDGTWGKAEVLGVEALRVNGTPADAVECAYAYWGKQFDLVISGLNLGVNIGTALINSGTFAAAWVAVNIGFVDQAMSLSWDTPREMHFYRHDGSEELEQQFHDYPGKRVGKFVREAIYENLWGARILNVNFPDRHTDEMVFTRPLTMLGDFFQEPVKLNEKAGTFKYLGERPKVDLREVGTDAVTIKQGKISVTPCRIDFLDETVFKKLKVEN